LQKLDGAKREDLVSDGAGARILGGDHEGLFLLSAMASGKSILRILRMHPG